MKISNERQGMLILIGILIAIVVAIPVTEFLIDWLISKVF